VEEAAVVINDTVPLVERAAEVIQQAAETLEKPSSVPQLKQTADALGDAAALLLRVQNNLTTSVRDITNASDTAKDAARNSQDRVLTVLASLDDVENTKSGFLSNITAFIKKLSGWAVIIAIVIGLGVLGLWPVITQGFINFMSGGFLLFRRSRETAKLLYEVKERPSEDKVDNVVTHFRTGMLGEAAWRHEKKRRDKTRNKKQLGQSAAPT